jgi:hypothetical protein
MTQRKKEAFREVFCAFAPADEPLWQNLAPRPCAGRLTLRHRGQIKAGDDYAGIIKAWQARASVVLLLVSSARNVELTCVHKTRQTMQGCAHIIPILLRPCRERGRSSPSSTLCHRSCFCSRPVGVIRSDTFLVGG